MKIKILLWTLLCVVLSACISQSGQMGHANDTENGRVFAVEDFDEVDINCDAKVTVNFVQDSRCEVTAKAAGSVLDDMNVTVRNGELIVSYRKPLSYSGNSPEIHLTIKAPSLNEFSAGGPTSFNCTSLVQSRNFEVDLSGASALNIGSLECRDLSVDISGVSLVGIDKAKCRDIDVDISGSSVLKGDYEAEKSVEYDLSGTSKLVVSARAAEVGIEAGGTSSITCDVKCERLEVETSGTSEVTLRGRAAYVKKSVSGMSVLNLSGLETGGF